MFFSFCFLKELYGNFQWIEFKCPNPLQSLEGNSLLLTTESLGVPGTLSIDRTIKPPRSFESAYPGLVINKYLINSLVFHYNKAILKTFKI